MDCSAKEREVVRGEEEKEEAVTAEKLEPGKKENGEEGDTTSPELSAGVTCVHGKGEVADDLWVSECPPAPGNLGVGVMALGIEPVPCLTCKLTTMSGVHR